jgi:hypothetical protein
MERGSSKKSESGIRNPFYYFLRIAFTVLFSEILIMILLPLLNIRSHLYASLLDGALLLIIVSPLIYRLIFVKLSNEIKMRIATEGELEKANAKLEEY